MPPVEDPTRRALATELGTSLPRSLDRLSDAELMSLARALEHARIRQEEAVETAIDRAMRFIPWGLRGTVKKVLIG